MDYLSFDEYQAYGGTLEKAAFDRLAYRAMRKIDGRTCCRLQRDTVIGEPVKRLMFELIGMIGNNDTASEHYSPAVASEGNDGYSVSYASGTILTPDTAEKQADALIEEYLQWERAQNGQLLLSCGLGTLR